MRIMLIPSLYLSSLLLISLGDESMRYVAIIYRHGQRTPVEPYPTDPWKNESLWPVKFGQLTNVGIKQHYDFGRYLRTRYGDFLSERFEPTEIYVRSSDVDRTLMSAQANLAGLYPPVGRAVWNPTMDWQPVPVHSLPKNEDAFIAMEKLCLPYKLEYEKFISTDAFKKELSQNQELMDYLTAYTGRKIKMYDDIEYIYSILYIQTLFNFPLPNWTHPVYPDKMYKPACYSFTLQTGTPYLGKIKAAPILQYIVAQMYNATKAIADGANEANAPVKLSMFSGHDTTVSNILHAMGLFDGNCPVFTASIIMELTYDNATATYFVSIYYRNTTAIDEPYLLDIPYCGTKCPLERFAKLYEEILNFNWDYECGKRIPSVLIVSFFLGIGIFITAYLAHKFHYIQSYHEDLDGIRFRYFYIRNVKEDKVVNS